jgi:hypothetical protein
MQIAKLALLTLLAILAGCATQVASPGKKLLDGDLANLLNADTKITLQRTACYGWCPAYKVVAMGDGQVVFTGYAGNDKEVEYRSTLSQDKVKELLIAFREIDYFSPMGDAGEDGPSCPSEMTDNPSANTSITIGTLSKKVHHYYGCEGSPMLPKLSKFEQSLDEIIGTVSWVRSLRQAELDISKPACVKPARRIIDPPPNHHPIYFETGSAKINASYKTLLEDDAKYFIAHTSGDVVLDSYTDMHGSKSYNVALSQKRAEAVRKALISLGVPEVRLHILANGKTKTETQTSQKSDAEYRRVDILYLGIDYELQEVNPACP